MYLWSPPSQPSTGAPDKYRHNGGPPGSLIQTRQTNEAGRNRASHPRRNRRAIRARGTAWRRRGAPDGAPRSRLEHRRSGRNTSQAAHVGHHRPRLCLAARRKYCLNGGRPRAHRNSRLTSPCRPTIGAKAPNGAPMAPPMEPAKMALTQAFRAQTASPGPSVWAPSCSPVPPRPNQACCRRGASRCCSMAR